jgi:hypothetical protein
MEVHKICGGAVMFIDSPLVAEWRCQKCGRLCPISETRIATPEAESRP